MAKHLAEQVPLAPASYPAMTDPVDYAYIPCLACGAQVLQRLMGKHSQFHEALQAASSG